MVRVIFEISLKLSRGRVGGTVKWARFAHLHRYHEDAHVKFLYRSDEMEVEDADDAVLAQREEDRIRDLADTDAEDYHQVSAIRNIQVIKVIRVEELTPLKPAEKARVGPIEVGDMVAAFAGLEMTASDLAAAAEFIKAKRASDLK